MISVNFKLTTAQVRLLIQIAYWDYTQLAPDLVVIPRREGVADMFIVTVRCLIGRGLVRHCPDDFPAYEATDEGKALASLIVRECRAVCAMADTMDERLSDLATAIKRCKSDAAARKKRRYRVGVAQ